MQSTSRQVGAAIGTAIIGTTLILGLGSVAGQLEDRGVPTEQAQQIASAVSTSAGQAIPGLAELPNGDVLVEGASAGFADAIKTVAWVAGIFVLLGLRRQPHAAEERGSRRVGGLLAAPLARGRPEQGVAR